MANYGLSTAEHKYGTGSFYSPYGSTSRSKALLITPSTGDFKIASGQDFIISLWVQYGDIYVGTANATYPLITFGNGGFTDGWSIGYRVGPNLGFGALPYFRYNGNTINTVFNGTNGGQISPSENGWSHIEVKRANGVITLTFTNATDIPTTTTANYSGAIGAGATGGAYVGASNPVIFNGNNGAYLDELFFARGVSQVQRRSPITSAINDGSLSTTVFLYQFDGNYYDDETGIQEYSSAISSTSAISAALTPILSLKTASANLNSAFTLTGEIRPVPGTIAFSSTDNSRFSLTAQLTEIYRIPPLVVDNNTGMFLDNISIDATIKKFGTGAFKNASIGTARSSAVTLGYGNNSWLAIIGDGTKVSKSTDSGATWTTSTTGGLTSAPSKIIYANGYFIATSGALAWSSTDGISWTAITMPSGYTAIASSITYANNYWNIVAWSPTAVTGGIIYVYRAAGQDAGLANIAPNFSSTTGRIEVGGRVRTSLNSVSVGGVAVSGTTTKFTLNTSETVSGGLKYNAYIYTSSNNTTWTIDNSLVQQTGSTGYLLSFGSIATDGANNWMVSYSSTTATAGEVYTKAGAGAWTKKTKTGVASTSSKVLYAVNKWWVNFDSQGYSSSDLGTTWTFATYGTALANSGAAGSNQLALLEDHNANGIGSEVKFVSTTTGTTWTNNRITGQINLPETIEYTAGNLNGKFSSWKTMDFWVYTTTPSVTNWIEQSAITHGNGYNPTTQKTWTVQVGGYGAATDRGQINFDFANQTAQLNSGNFTNNAWHHVRISRNGLNTAMYLDGTRVGTDTLTSALPANTNPLVFGGFKSTGATNYYFDEFYLSETLLTDPSVTTFTVPTIAWASDANTSLLLHFNGDLLDDFNVPPNADLISRSTLAVQANTAYSASSAISSTSQLTAVGYRVQETILGAFTNASLSAIPTVYIPAAAAVSSTSTLVVEVIRVKNAVSNLSSNTSVQTTPVKTANAQVSLTAFVSTITIDTVTRDLSINISSSSNLSINCVKIARVNADLTTTTQVLATITRIKSAASAISSNSTLVATQVRGRTANANLNAIAALTSNPVKVITAQAVLTVNAFELLTGENIKKTTVNLTSSSSLNAQATITRTTGVQLTSTSSITANTIKAVQAQINIAESTSMAVQANRIQQAAAGISSASTLAAAIVRVRSAQVTINAMFAEMVTATKAGPSEAGLTARFALACTAGVQRSTAQASLTTQVLWSYIYDKTIPLNQALDLYVIPADTRLYVIPASTAVWIIEPDSRAYIIETDLREYKITPAGTEFTIEG